MAFRQCQPAPDNESDDVVCEVTQAHVPKMS